MISGIGAFSGVSFPGLAESANSDGQRSKQGDSGRRSSSSSAPVLNNTDATGLKLSAEQRKVIQELHQQARDVRVQEQTHNADGSAPSRAATQNIGNQLYTPSGVVASKAYLAQAQQYLNLSSSTTQADPKATMERATAAYRRMGGETGLAPFGTGISLSV